MLPMEWMMRMMRMKKMKRSSPIWRSFLLKELPLQSKERSPQLLPIRISWQKITAQHLHSSGWTADYKPLISRANLHLKLSSDVLKNSLRMILELDWLPWISTDPLWNEDGRMMTAVMMRMMRMMIVPAIQLHGRVGLHSIEWLIPEWFGVLNWLETSASTFDHNICCEQRKTGDNRSAAIKAAQESIRVHFKVIGSDKPNQIEWIALTIFFCMKSQLITSERENTPTIQSAVRYSFLQLREHMEHLNASSNHLWMTFGCTENSSANRWALWLWVVHLECALCQHWMINLGLGVSRIRSPKKPWKRCDQQHQRMT